MIGDMVFGFLVLAVLAIFVAHLFMLGTPYIKMEFCVGRPRYYVWIRRFMGYDDLAGSCDTLEAARDLMKRVRSNPPRTYQ